MRLVRRILIPWTFDKSCGLRPGHVFIAWIIISMLNERPSTKPDADRWHFALCRLPFAIIMGHAVNGFRGNRRVTVPYHLCDLRECPCVCVCKCVIASASHHAATEPQLTWWQHDNVSHRIASHRMAWHTTTRTWTRTRTGTRTST